MSIIHFLNVKQGDCAFIQHNTGHVTMIDVFNATKPEEGRSLQAILEAMTKSVATAPGNFNQKAYPVNPIKYMKDLNISSIFRFILTHPDMDHMGGLKDLFDTFEVANFWDIDHNRDITDFENTPYSEEDWKFYKRLRNSTSDPKRLTLYDGAIGQYYNRGDDGRLGDGLTVLAPSRGLVEEANQTDDHNDCSYVLLYQTGGNKIIFGGDSHDKTWEFILDNHKNLVSDVDVLIAPHHGRKSGRSYAFLDVLKPKITYFGNAYSEHLAYGAWSQRNLAHITNNQANCIITNISSAGIDIYVTNETFARASNKLTFFQDQLKAWFFGAL